MNHFKELMLVGSTQMLRLWFGITACFFAIFITSESALTNPEYALGFAIVPQVYWAIAFMVNGAVLIYGAITSKYSKIGLILEGILGTALWAAVGITVMISQGSLGAVTIATFLSVYLLIRYPTWHED